MDKIRKAKERQYFFRRMFLTRSGLDLRTFVANSALSLLGALWGHFWPKFGVCVRVWRRSYGMIFTNFECLEVPEGHDPSLGQPPKNSHPLVSEILKWYACQNVLVKFLTKWLSKSRLRSFYSMTLNVFPCIVLMKFHSVRTDSYEWHYLFYIVTTVFLREHPQVTTLFLGFKSNDILLVTWTTTNWNISS